MVEKLLEQLKKFYFWSYLYLLLLLIFVVVEFSVKILVKIQITKASDLQVWNFYGRFDGSFRSLHTAALKMRKMGLNCKSIHFVWIVWHFCCHMGFKSSDGGFEIIKYRTYILISEGLNCAHKIDTCVPSASWTVCANIL